MTTFPSHCKKQSDRQAPLSSVTHPDQDRNTLARISSADVGEIYTDFQGLDLMDSPRQLDGRDHPPTDQQPPGLTEVEPISARTLYIWDLLFA